MSFAALTERPKETGLELPGGPAELPCLPEIAEHLAKTETLVMQMAARSALSYGRIATALV